MVLAVSTSLSAYAAPTFSNHAISSSYTAPGSTTVAGGNLWYIESASSGTYPRHYIASMSTVGAVTDYDVSHPSGFTDFSIIGITTGADGNIWFDGRPSTVTSGTYIGSLNISTGAVAYYSSSLGQNAPSPLVATSDGSLWYYSKNYTDAQNYTDFVKFNPSTGTSTIGFSADRYSIITSINSGPDGLLWYTDQYYNRVNSYGTGGASYLIPSTGLYPGGVIEGSDGNIWFTESGKIGKLTLSSGVITEYSLPTSTYAGSLAAGPDGALWFNETSSGINKIGRITSSGNITDYTIPGTSVSFTGRLAAGPDNAMWFGYSDSTGAKLGSITTAPTFTNSYSLSSSYTTPSKATVAGGSLWFTEVYSSGYHYIGNMTTSGTVVNYDVSHPTGATSFNITSIITGADGNIWFNGITNANGIYAGRLDISTGAVTYYGSTVSSYVSPGAIVTGSDGNLWYYVRSNSAQGYTNLVYVNPSTGITTTSAHYFDSYSIITSMASGPDGGLWLTDQYYNRIEVYNPSNNTGASYSIPNSNSTTYPFSMTSGPDGAMWYSDYPLSGGSSRITKLTTSGVFTQYTLPSGVYAPAPVTGPDGAGWFVDSNNGTKKIGRITSSGVFTESPKPTGATTITAPVFGPDNALWFGYTDSSGAKFGRFGY